MRARRDGFTLLEVIAVVLLTGILIGFTTNFYLDLARQSRAAVDTARHTRRAVVLLDRVARDLESAMLVRKPGPVDPLFWPWLFLAESDDPAGGATRLKFSSRSRRPRSPQAAESDVEMVAWLLARSEDGAGYQLVRWSSPRLPPGRDLSFPPTEDGDPVARGIAAFGVFLTGEGGEPVARWDSTALVDASELPLAAEIRVSLLADEESDVVLGPFVRRVLLPMRPIDVEAQLEAAGARRAGGRDADGDGIPDEEEDEDGDGVPDAEQDEDVAGGGDADARGMTGAECLASSAAAQAFVASLGPAEQAVVQSLLPQPMSVLAPQLAAIGFRVPPECQ